MEKASVFLSHSQAASRMVADALREWLPNVVQSVDPFTSSVDIGVGASWWPVIGDRLGRSELGVICVTPDNIERPWLYFEAGAIWMRFGADLRSKVVPYVLGMDVGELIVPFSNFQATSATKSGTLNLVQAVNEIAPVPVTDLVAAFERWWPELEPKLAEAREQIDAKVPERSDREILDEILAYVRSLAVARGRELAITEERVREEMANQRAMLDFIREQDDHAAGAPISKREAVRLALLEQFRPFSETELQRMVRDFIGREAEPDS